MSGAICGLQLAICNLQFLLFLNPGSSLLAEPSMFERYTEKARRVIFFARYEASQFGAQAIEAEHILLGLLREDKQLTQKFFRSPHSTVESIRKEIEHRSVLKHNGAASLHFPFSANPKRMLSYTPHQTD